MYETKELVNNPIKTIHEPVKLIRGANLGSEEAIGSGPLSAVARDIKVATTQKGTDLH